MRRFQNQVRRCNDLLVSLDQTLAVSGAVLGAIGALATIVARLRADPAPAIVTGTRRAVGGVRRRIAGPTRAPGDSPAPERAAPVISTTTTGPLASLPTQADDAPVSPARAATRAVEPAAAPAAGAPGPTQQATRGTLRRRPRRDGRSNAELDDELVTSTALGWFVLWMVATLAIGYVRTEVSVLQILAQVAVAGSLIALGSVVYDIVRHRARHVGWMIDLFLVIAAIAAIPLWFHRPWFGQGRFDRLDDWLPPGGSIDVRLNQTLKDYGPGIVAHVLVQAAGIAALVAIALYIVATIVRRARGRYGHQPLDRWVSLSALAVTVIGAVCASGSAVSVPARIFGSSSFTTADRGTTVGDGAPALALRADRRGRIFLLVARCGDDRIVALSVDGRVVVDPRTRNGTGFGRPVGGGVTTTGVPAGTGPVTVVVRSTRRYRTTVVFARRPRPNRFIPLRTKDTLAAFYKRGHGC